MGNIIKWIKNMPNLKNLSTIFFLLLDTSKGCRLFKSWCFFEDCLFTLVLITTSCSWWILQFKKMQIFNSHLWLLVRRLCSLTLKQSWSALKLVGAIWTGQHLTTWLVFLHFRNAHSLAFTFKSTFHRIPF